ncbi:MAG: peptide-methionine (S)-S-oxide reductase MsrA [Firmicutes bacterium]|nr:peptide-methionine (S)-S-oxide reductase MsrA [Bacillota bacterium]
MAAFSEKKPTEVATLGGGCFWCLEAVFSDLHGVLRVQSGYAGGTIPNPTYQQVCTGTTGHAEVVQITFEPTIISYSTLLDVFFGIHDPTTLNRQGEDIGTQYRSVIFCHSQEQKEMAQQKIKEIEQEALWDDPVVTAVEEFINFYPAEEYHRNYFALNPDNSYCRMVISPKVAKFRTKFTDLLRSGKN